MQLGSRAGMCQAPAWNVHEVAFPRYCHCFSLAESCHEPDLSLAIFFSDAVLSVQSPRRQHMDKRPGYCGFFESQSSCIYSHDGT